MRRDAETRIAGLRAAAEARAAREREDALRREAAELRATLASELARATVESRRDALDARAAFLGRVFDRARALLPEALATAEARTRLVERAREALALVPPGAAVLTCPPGLTEPLASLAASHGALRVETDDAMPAGFRVTAADGALVVDGTLESLLELDRDALAIEVLRRLEGGTEP